MKNNILSKTRSARLIMSALAVFGFSALLLTPATSAQDIDKNLQCGANLQFTVPEEGCPVDQGGTSAADRVDQIVTQIINILSLAVGVVAVFMIIIGGLRYITSGGESGSVTGAKNTILYAVVGLIVVALAQVIVRFVIERATLDGATGSSSID